MMALVPARLPASVKRQANAATHARKVAILEGCAQPVLDPGINTSTRRLLARFGIGVVDVPGEGCCGALVHHLGKEEAALDFARRNVDAWIPLIDDGLEAIVITASGCGTTIKDYGFMLREDPAYADKAARVSAHAKDITEYLATLDIPQGNGQQITVAYHSACSMQHGQQITTLPKALLKSAGFVVADVPEGHLCCGSAGTYNLLQPEIASRLRARKLENIRTTRPDLVATGNIGCITQLAGEDLPVLHTVELLDWMAGGPVPGRIARLVEQRGLAAEAEPA